MSQTTEALLNLEELPHFLTSLLPTLPPHCVILLRGDLASGKTTLISELCKLLDCTTQTSSPTFSLQNIYHSPTHTLYHYDFYRKDLSEFLELGFLEGFDLQGWHCVEWGDEKLEQILRNSGFKVVIITISKEEQKRRYKVVQ